MDKNELKEIRKQKFAQMEQQLKEMHPKEEDSLFYYHSSEDRIVLSHALFWVMTLPQCLKGKIRKERLPSVTTFSPRDSLSKLSSPLGLPKEFFLLLRQYEEEMLDSYLQDTEEFPTMLHYSNILYEYLPIVINAIHDLNKDKDARKLAAIAVVTGGYGGDMPEAMANELLDDMDFFRGKVKCKKIEEKLPQLMDMVEVEIKR